VHLPTPIEYEHTGRKLFKRQGNSANEESDACLRSRFRLRRAHHLTCEVLADEQLPFMYFKPTIKMFTVRDGRSSCCCGCIAKLCNAAESGRIPWPGASPTSVELALGHGRPFAARLSLERRALPYFPALHCSAPTASPRASARRFQLTHAVPDCIELCVNAVPLNVRIAAIHHFGPSTVMLRCCIAEIIRHCAPHLWRPRLNPCSFPSPHNLSRMSTFWPLLAGVWCSS